MQATGQCAAERAAHPGEHRVGANTAGGTLQGDWDSSGEYIHCMSVCVANVSM